MAGNPLRKFQKRKPKQTNRYRTFWCKETPCYTYIPVITSGPEVSNRTVMIICTDSVDCNCQNPCILDFAEASRYKATIVRLQ